MFTLSHIFVIHLPYGCFVLQNMGKKRKWTSLTEDASNIKRVSNVIHFTWMISFAAYICFIQLVFSSVKTVKLHLV